MRSSGVYIVTLTNEQPISVNAHDSRRAHLCIKVNRDHCKIGKASNLFGRKKNYDRTFGENNVRFKVIAYTNDIASAESAILNRLRRYRLRGVNGRLNEWLCGIAPETAEALAIEAMRQDNLTFILAEQSEHAV